jgi:hypothetical protein
VDALEAVLSLLDFMVTAAPAAAAMALCLSTTLLRVLEQPILAAVVAAAENLPLAPSVAAVTAAQV